MEKKSPEYIASLIIKYRNDELTVAERAELDVWLSASENNLLKLEEWNDDESILKRLSDFDNIDEEKGWLKLEERKAKSVKKGRVATLFRVSLAAASLLIILLAGYWFLKPIDVNSTNNKATMTASKDVKAPEVNKATITMADGSVVYLDNAKKGRLASQGSVSILMQADGEISYKISSDKSGNSKPVYNTLSNPRGSKVINMALADGSRVWLNAGSTITYPVSFPGNNRKVNITGEAYFEVAPDTKRPFFVDAGEMQVQVLGTHFNLKAFADEDAIKATLLEGVVKVKNNEKSLLLKPGQQANLTPGNNLNAVSNIDLSEVMAWKEGLFQFNNSDIQTVMREISRWYDVDVSYPKGIPNDKYWGSIRRDQNLSDVFKVLKESGANFKIEGREVIVLPE